MVQKKSKLKKIIIPIIAAVFIGFFAVIGLKTAGQFKNVSLNRGVDTNIAPTPKPEIKIKRAYVVAAYLANEKDDITKEELSALAKDGKLIATDNDKEDVARILKSEFQTTSPSVSQIKLTKDQLAILRLESLNPAFKVLTVDKKSVWEDDGYSLVAEVTKKGQEQSFDKSKLIKMTSVGDVILGRTVYKKMVDKGFLSPFENVANRLADADLTFGNLETPLSDAIKPPTEGMSFLVPKKAIEGILASGFDVLALANNHSTNFGEKTFKDTLDLLEENKIEYVGGGRSEVDAKSYKTINVKGKKFAFLNTNSIVGDLAAKGDSAGVWHINLEPWGKIDQKQVDELLEKLREAKKEADFAVVMVHWSKEYTHDPNNEMKNLAHQLIDNGADLIVGTHPHWTQGIEVYKDKFIAYSLGNFVFDQDWSKETKQGLIMDTIFYKDKLLNVSLAPVLIEDFHKPRILDKKEGKVIMDAVWESSKKISKEF
ncbi:TPA: hypothetical protein DDW69_00260 [candidate division CPR2 bacterium]|uniref:Capsule synthesis protein CapA domain-containing protein n=1 Tax=candidate division CPR2 bacterium GW2011_GWC1_41_48 TaxID=1618344 RepID=A0A0G0W9H3_UNCC2|nr:MAG: hypothetical protein UT47_C0005G0018 [candidate division CPR2 bacterium GW2011_GWC2_39_35]KKS08707.1 MAG: hypothetical protein UU65_C0005G0018 [candidate division CPR2 bacterium GW2011_GWC1_41_48]HBG81256.1 hypothetical protein [candidate division CPR2 bacterium]HCL99788.1 hypothetical protein [candidate division CPR2 bacterium]